MLTILGYSINATIVIFDRIRENLAALSERTWNIRRYTTDAQFYEKLSGILPLTEKLSPEE